MSPCGYHTFQRLFSTRALETGRRLLDGLGSIIELWKDGSSSEGGSLSRSLGRSRLPARAGVLVKGRERRSFQRGRNRLLGRCRGLDMLQLPNEFHFLLDSSGCLDYRFLVGLLSFQTGFGHDKDARPVGSLDFDELARSKDGSSSSMKWIHRSWRAAKNRLIRHGCWF